MLFSESLDAILDIVAEASMVIAVYYILKLRKYDANPVMMIFSPLVFYKYLVFLVSLVVVFVAIDIVADDLLHNPQLLVVGFEFGLAAGSFGIMMITRRLYVQVAHPERLRAKLSHELDEVMRRRQAYKLDRFRQDNR